MNAIVINSPTTQTAKPFVPSAYQQRFFDWLVNGRGSCVLIAVAGAGKTTSVTRSLRLIPERCHVQLFAFNVPVAGELKERLEEMKETCARPFKNFRAGTFHSVCYGVVKRHLNLPFELKADAGKLLKLCRSHLGETELGLYGEFISELVGLAKGEGIGALVPDTEERWWNLIAHHDLSLDSTEASEPRAVELARWLLGLSNKVARDGVIDFDDLLYLPCLWKLRLWQNDWVFVDEAQDTNPVRRAIARLALKPGGRLVAVGDPKQAIYGFTGASADAIELIKKEFNAIELPLTVCYRCGTAIVDAARQFVPYIEVADNAPEGSVVTLLPDAALARLTNDDVILCRNSAPLLTLAYQLIAKRRAVRVLGREIGTGLVNLIKKMNAATIERLLVKLDEYLQREIVKMTARGEEQKIAGLSDRVSCVRVIIDHLKETERTIPKLVTAINEMFNDKAGALTLSTIHKAKGREWTRVGVLRQDLMPSPWARQAWQAEQELNLIYVCYTRAREELIFIAEDPRAKQEEK